MNPIRTIVVPYDFSSHSEAALEIANEMAELFGAELHLLHVVRPLPYGYVGDLDMSFGVGNSQRPLHDSCERKLEDVATACKTPPDRIHVHVVEAANIAHAIDSEAERLGADLIAMGTHGHTGLAHVLMGSIAEATTRHAPCPVLTVPRRAEMHDRAVRREASRHPPAGSF